MKKTRLVAQILLALCSFNTLAETGDRAGPPLLIDASTIGTITGSSVASNAYSESVMVWTVHDPSDDSTQLKMQRFTNWGGMLGAPIQIAGPGILISNAQVLLKNDGTALVVWQESGVDSSGSAILFQSFDVNGQALTPAQIVNQTETGDQQTPHLALGWDENFAAIAWDAPAPEGGYAAMVRTVGFFSGTVSFVSNEFRVNAMAELNPTKAKTIVTSGGDLRAYWLGRNDASVTSDQILEQHFYANGNPDQYFPQQVAPGTAGIYAEVTDFAVARSNQGYRSLLIVANGEVYMADPNASAQPFYVANATECRSPKLSSSEWSTLAAGFECLYEGRHQAFLAIRDYGLPGTPKLIAPELTGLYPESAVRIGSAGLDVDGNVLVSVQAPEDGIQFNSSLIAYRLRGYKIIDNSVRMLTSGTVAPGEDFSIEVTARNDNAYTQILSHNVQKGVSLAIDLPPGSSFLGAEGADWSCADEGVVRCEYQKQLEGKQEATVTIRATGFPGFGTANFLATLDSYVNARPNRPTAAGSIEVGVPDRSPDPVTLEPYQDVARSQRLERGFAVAGINAAIPISVTNGRYIVNWGPEQTAPGLVRPGDYITVLQVSASELSTTVSTTLNFGDQATVLTSTTEAQDTVPDPIYFNTNNYVPLGSVQTSNAKTVNGITHPTSITVQNGSYSVNGGAFTTAAGTVSPGDSIVLRHTAALSISTETKTTVIIGGSSASFSSITGTSDTIPNAFDFADLTGVARNTLQTSSAVTIAGINTWVTATIVGGEFSINGGAYSANSRSVQNGDQVRVRHTSSAAYSTLTRTELSIGGVVGAFETTTTGPDTVPDFLYSTTSTNVRVGSVVNSGTLTISGTDAPAPISVSNGSYAINGGTFVSTPSLVDPGATVVIRHTASSNFLTTTVTTLNVGGVTAQLTSTTEAQDTIPTAFDPVDVFNVARGTVQTSAPITVSGINAPAAISVSAGGSYSINGGAFTSVAGTVAAGDSVRVQHVSAAGFSAVVSTVLSIGGVNGTFASTTEAIDTTPSAFDLIDVSNVLRGSVQTSTAIVVAGINAPAAISVSGGSYSVNGGAFVTTAGTVNAGDSVQVRHTAAATFATTTDTVLTIGGVSATFSSLTEAMDTSPNAFTLVDQSGLATNVAATSAPISVTGINAPTAISISGGSYAINGGAFVTTAGLVNPGDQVQVRVTTAHSASTAVSASLVIGGVSDIFTATTGSVDTTPAAFVLTDVVDARRSKAVISNTLTVSGINAAVAISVSGGGSVKYSKNGAAFTATAGTVVNGDQIRLQLTASAAANTVTDAVLTMGGISDTWSVTTGTR